MSNNRDQPGHPWPIGIRLEVLPGNSLVEQFSFAKRFGFDAVELPGRYLDNYRDELMACKDRLPLPVSSVSLGFEGSLASDDAALRQRCADDLVDLFGLCRDVGASGLVMPPLLKQDACRLPRPSQPMTDRIRAADDLLAQQLPSIAQAAADHQVCLLLEPVNRFEADYMNQLGSAFDICQRVNHPNLGITADAFHMQMEELHPDQSIRQAAPWIKHVHIAENTRVEPGPGSLNLSPIFKALREINYTGAIVVECRALSGPAEATLPECSAYIRRLINDS